MHSQLENLVVWKIISIFAAEILNNYVVMRKVIDIKEQPITTNSGLKLIRRVTTILMPNGKYRHPVDYYDASNEPVLITTEERNRRRVPVYPEVL